MDTVLGTELPLAGAPMAGGPTTIALAEAVAGAGAFPFLPAGYKTPDALASDIAVLRGTGVPFGVNLFVPRSQEIDEVAYREYAAEVRSEADELGVELSPGPVSDDDHWREKIALLVANPVPVVSLTFGLPAAADIAALRSAGTRVFATVTSVAEAAVSQERGVDGLVVQGASAGGHSAIHDPHLNPASVSTGEVVAEVCASTELPVVAAGGVDGAEAARALLAAGADAVAVGTLLLRTDEAGTSATHRAALADPERNETIITRAFTGRPARALRNGFIDRHGETAPTAYPQLHHLTRPLRQAAANAGDAERLHLWAGTGYRSATEGPAAEVIRGLASGL